MLPLPPKTNCGGSLAKARGFGGKYGGGGGMTGMKVGRPRGLTVDEDVRGNLLLPCCG